MSSNVPEFITMRQVTDDDHADDDDDDDNADVQLDSDSKDDNNVD